MGESSESTNAGAGHDARSCGRIGNHQVCPIVLARKVLCHRFASGIDALNCHASVGEVSSQQIANFAGDGASLCHLPEARLLALGAGI
jgi:hypothetical protein